jgi:hypothetical protein
MALTPSLTHRAIIKLERGASTIFTQEATMSATLCILLLALADEGVPTGATKLLAGEDMYKKAAGNEVLLDGIVERTPTTGRPLGMTRFNVFRLRYQDSTGKEEARELHIPEKAFLVSGHLGKKVRVAGKLVETKLENGTINELWPAWMQPLTGPLAVAPGPDGVFARCDWQPEDARKRGTQQFVFRSADQLAIAMRVKGPSAGETATNLLAKRLNLPAIDWEKQMIVCVSAGFQGPAIEGLAITSVKEVGDTLQVRYRLLPTKGEGAGFGYPAQSVLVKRSTAEVRFEQEPAPPKR